MLSPVFISLKTKTGSGYLFGHVICCYGNNPINRNYLRQSFIMARLEVFRTYGSQDSPPL